MATATESRTAQEAIASNRFWYHTLEVAPGVTTPGRFDLRPIVDRLPWPDIRGKRCLDVGPYDGFFSFELERRGASEVVAADIGSAADWDWPYANRSHGPRVIAAATGERTGTGFRIAKELLGSRAERVELSVYDLTPERVGRFDVVVCGSLMLHLRDPVRALEAIRGVCDEWFLSAETIKRSLSLVARRKPRAEMLGGERCQWWIPNVAGHRLMLEAAGFEIERVTGAYSVPPGPGHPSHSWSLTRRLRATLTGRRPGVPHAAVLCRPPGVRPSEGGAGGQTLTAASSDADGATGV